MLTCPLVWNAATASVPITTVIINNKFSVRVPSKSSCWGIKKKIVLLVWYGRRRKQVMTRDHHHVFCVRRLGIPRTPPSFSQKTTRELGTSDPLGRAAHLACRAHAWETPPEPDGSGTARRKTTTPARPPAPPPIETKRNETRPGPGAQQPSRQKRSRSRGLASPSS